MPCHLPRTLFISLLNAIITNPKRICVCPNKTKQAQLFPGIHTFAGSQFHFTKVLLPSVFKQKHALHRHRISLPELLLFLNFNAPSMKKVVMIEQSEESMEKCKPCLSLFNKPVRICVKAASLKRTTRLISQGFWNDADH